MKPWAFNLLLFFFVYVPLTLALGLLVEAFRVDATDAGAGYEIFLWLVIVLQMVIPTLLLFTLSYFFVGWLVRDSTSVRRRAISLGVIGLSLPLLQAFLWSGSDLSLTFAIVGVVPAMILGVMSRFPKRLPLA